MGACEEYELLLAVRLDGELTSEEEARLEAHLARCPACRALAEELEGAHDALARMEELPAPPDFAQGVMARLRAGEESAPAREETPKVIPLFRRPQVRALVSLAACAAVCMGVYQAGLFRPTGSNADRAYTFSATAASAEDGETAAAQAPLQGQAAAPEQEELAPETRDVPADVPQGNGTAQSEPASGPAVYGVSGGRSTSSRAAGEEGTQKQTGTAEAAQEPSVGVGSAQAQPGEAETPQGQADGPDRMGGQLGQTGPDQGQPQETEAVRRPSDETETGQGQSGETEAAQEQPEANGADQAANGAENAQALPGAVSAQAAPEADAVLTLSVLPQGWQEVLGEELQWQTGEEGDWCLITGAQMEALLTLAQEQGQDLTGAASERIDADDWCVLVVTGAPAEG